MCFLCYGLRWRFICYRGSILGWSGSWITIVGLGLVYDRQRNDGEADERGIETKTGLLERMLLGFEGND